MQASTISAAKEQALIWMRYVVSVSKKILSCLILVYFILKTGKRQGFYSSLYIRSASSYSSRISWGGILSNRLTATMAAKDSRKPGMIS